MPWSRCSSCHATGRVACVSCNGYGSMTTTETTTSACSVCHRLGHCKSCNLSALGDCVGCVSTPANDCQRQNCNRGRANGRNCSACVARVQQCAVCWGTAKCPVCRGTGNCQTCAGNGTVQTHRSVPTTCGGCDGARTVTCSSCQNGWMWTE